MSNVHWGSLAIGVVLGLFGMPVLTQVMAKAKTS